MDPRRVAGHTQRQRQTGIIQMILVTEGLIRWPKNEVAVLFRTRQWGRQVGEVHLPASGGGGAGRKCRGQQGRERRP